MCFFTLHCVYLICVALLGFVVCSVCVSCLMCDVTTRVLDCVLATVCFVPLYRVKFVVYAVSYVMLFEC